MLGIGPQPRAQFVNVLSLSMVCRKSFSDVNLHNLLLKGRGTPPNVHCMGRAGWAGKCCPNSLGIGLQPRAQFVNVLSLKYGL